MAEKLKGYYPIMPTPYREDGEVDLESVSRLTHFLIDNGSQGMSPNGGDSEARQLKVDERKRVLELVPGVVGGVVDQHPNRPQLAAGPLNLRARGLDVAEAVVDEDRLGRAGLGGLLGQRFRILDQEIDEGDARTLGAEVLDDAGADACPPPVTKTTRSLRLG